eukprot:CAMPEP_0174701520 /NCGR_PEP_ID=MMETSP1094-20130205/6129_1 /TAXON_ID=156173 /ORGANISM="Chrysochromulina brevifilum, Strain UTEX LB 985" /LENGTH=158 /DNA_ID=CAMNT_0015899179 /DNA_START=860 /DNA_END=1336 /DNA_ORIENTATION=+
MSSIIWHMSSDLPLRLPCAHKDCARPKRDKAPLPFVYQPELSRSNTASTGFPKPANAARHLSGLYASFLVEIPGDLKSRQHFNAMLILSIFNEGDIMVPPCSHHVGVTRHDLERIVDDAERASPVMMVFGGICSGGSLFATACLATRLNRPIHWPLDP